MRWAKIVLLFQAIITLIIGMAFFSQLTKIGVADITDITKEFADSSPTQETVSITLDNLRARYTVASYALLVIGLIEIIIIIRLFS